MGSYIGYAMASTPQYRNRLKNERSINDKMSRGIWEEMENRKTDKARMEKTRGTRKERREVKKKKEKREEFRALMMEEEIVIARIVEGKEREEEEEELIELRAVEEMVSRQFHKYLKVFKKKESEMMLMRKAWDHAIDIREGFVPKKGKIYPLSRVEREEF